MVEETSQEGTGASTLTWAAVVGLAIGAATSTWLRDAGWVAVLLYCAGMALAGFVFASKLSSADFDLHRSTEASDRRCSSHRVNRGEETNLWAAGLIVVGFLGISGYLGALIGARRRKPRPPQPDLT